jgi:pentatricopeptide repeat protein
MKQRHMQPDVKTYTSLIDRLCKVENISEAMQFFEEMRKCGVHPDVKIYSSIINGFCKMGKMNEAK